MKYIVTLELTTIAKRKIGVEAKNKDAAANTAKAYAEVQISGLSPSTIDWSEIESEEIDVIEVVEEP